MSVAIKICGVNEPASVHAALRGGAQYIGFVLHGASPRAVDLHLASQLMAKIPSGINKVALLVDPTNDALMALQSLQFDLLQLHGAESPRRIAAIAAITALPLMKALPIATAEDFEAVADYAPLVAQFLFDAKPPGGAALPGGNAQAFDWRLLAARSFPRPWMLAGGLTPSNVAAAITISGARMVDVSSGVEDRPGVKNCAKIAAFCAAVQGV